MDIKRTPVKSASIASIGHHPESKTLAVEFKNGGVYHYQGVSAEAHQALVSAKSIGQHFGQNFRGMKFDQK
jgi:hypothetical protein